MELADLVQFAKEAKGPGAWTSGNLIRIGGLLAGKVNSLENLSGGEKLKLVQRVLLQGLAEVENKEIAEPGLSKEEIQKIHDRYDVLEATIADVLPVSLELAIKAARGGLDLKKIKPSSWVKFCSCFATTVVHHLASMNLISEAHATQARQALAVVVEKAGAAAAAKEAAEEAPKEEKKEEPPKETSKSEPEEAQKSSETSPATVAS
jgi:ribosomal protein L12E/L44/L45/RPP1/RPP2